MKSLMLLFRELLEESGSWCCISTNRDLKTVTARFENEGLSFLTISLANYGKDLQKSLDQGFVSHDLFTGFQFRGGLPQLFGGFLDLIFDRGTGRLLDEPSVDAIRCLRQITLSFAKININCTENRRRAAIQSFVECEQQIKISDSTLPLEDLSSFGKIGRMLFRDMFCHIDQLIYKGEIVPKHGPGATADHLLGNAKYKGRTWTTRLEEVFPAGEFLYPNWRQYLQEPPTLLEPGSEQPVKVITVPKTQKTPRVIAMEPSYMQFMQQGISEAMTEYVQRDYLLRTLTGWKDQTPNQRLAQLGSLNGELATLDLSEASDRVSYQHVRELLAHSPWFLKGVDACRSRKADVPGQNHIMRLAKFAPMGSALCFPFENIVFLTLIFLGISKELKRPVNMGDVKSLINQVRVYGDDLIVPVRYVRSVVATLELFGYKVNTAKSFWTGKFRESCGKDYYDGQDVSIVKVRSSFPSQRRNASEIISFVSFRNQLYKAGYWRTVKWLDAQLERLIPFPAVAETSPILGRFQFSGYDSEKWDSRLQRPMVKGVVPHVTIPVNKLGGYSALHKFFLKRGSEPVMDTKHLERSGRPVCVDIITRMASSY